MNDKVVFDIETKNSFADVGGRDNFKDLQVSIIGAYSYNQDKYFCFDENELERFGALAKSAGLLIGFSSKRFDLLVLEKYFNFSLALIPHFDILEEVEKIFGRRVGLGILAEANLGVGQGKTGTGLEAIELYRQGKMDELKNYCLQDVKLTKEIFDLIKAQGHLWIPQRYSPMMVKVTILYKEVEASPQAKLI